MKKFLCFVLSILCLCTSVLVSAQPSTYQEGLIEQIYSRMPEMKVYVRLGEQVGDQEITGYLNSKELQTVSHQPFQRENGVSFVLMFDCSTSVSSSQMTKMKQTAVNFVNNSAYENDCFTVVAFGETIEILTDSTATREQVTDAIRSLRNNQNGTVLYDAVDAVRQITAQMPESAPDKQMCVIFTDAVDYNLGGTTNVEVLRVAESSGTPIYAVAINPGDKASIDSLGAIARSSGGDVFVATGGNIEKAFGEAVSQLDNLYEIEFQSDSNKVSLTEENFSICVGEKTAGKVLERKFRSAAWKKDDTAPTILSTEVLSDQELSIRFSEPVDNAGKPENYTVKNGAQTFQIQDVRYDEESCTAILSFQEYLGSGEYVVTLSNITDSTMEQNRLSAPHTFRLTGWAAFMASLKGSKGGSAGWLFVLLIVIILSIIFAVLLKKKKTVVVVDGKEVPADSVQYEYQNPQAELPKAYLKLMMETADGNTATMDINLVQSVIFGRATSCEVTIDDSNLSRQHFAIEAEDGMLFIQNLSETNGTLLNGIMLQSKRQLSVGDVIAAGQEHFTVIKIQ